MNLRRNLHPLLAAASIAALLLLHPGAAVAAQLPAEPAEEAAPDTAPEDKTLTVAGFTIRPVARTRQEYGFFSLFEYRDQLLAGTYCGGRAQGQCGVFTGAPGFDRLQRIKPPLDLGESVYVMAQFNGVLYANTENRGIVIRSRDGRTWERVFTEHGFPDSTDQMGAGLAVFGGRIYASTTNLNPKQSSRLFSSPGGDPGTWVREASFGTKPLVQIRELIVFQDRLLALGYDYGAKRAAAFSLGESGLWESYPLDPGGRLASKRILKACLWKGVLWFTTSPVDGETRVPPAGVWRWDGKALKNVYNDPRRAVGTAIVPYDGALWMVDMVNWNAKEGRAGLHRSPSGEAGTWSEVWAFPQPEAMALFPYRGRLYAGTRQTEGTGNVFEIAPAVRE